MLKRICLLSTFILIGFWSCKNEKPTPKVIYEDSQSKTPKVEKPDTTAIKIADLPILMEGTKYLIHHQQDEGADR